MSESVAAILDFRFVWFYLFLLTVTLILLNMKVLDYFTPNVLKGTCLTFPVTAEAFFLKQGEDFGSIEESSLAKTGVSKLSCSFIFSVILPKNETLSVYSLLFPSMLR